MEEKQVIQSDNASAAQVGAEEPKEVITKSTEELLKALKSTAAENKLMRQKLAEIKKASEEDKTKVMQESGQWKELAEMRKHEAESFKAQAETLKGAFATKLVADAVSLEAAKMGCVDTDSLVRLVNLDQFPIDENLNVDKAIVVEKLENAKKSMPYFFQKQAPTISTGIPAKDQGKIVTKPLEKMSKQEIESLLREKFKK